jgi:hypothetical protein
VLASILTLGLVAALFSGTLTNLFRGALIPFGGTVQEQVTVKYLPLGQTTAPNFSFTQANRTRFTNLATQNVYFGQQFNDFRDINLALFEQTVPSGERLVTPTELDPAIPHKFEVTALNLTGAQNIEVLALMVDAEAYNKVFVSNFVAQADTLCETQEDESEDCQKYLEEMVKDADFVRFFNLTATSPTHELIVPRFLTSETTSPTPPAPLDTTLLGSYSKNTDFSKARKLVLINSNNSLVSKYLAKRVEIDQENLTLNYCPLPPEPITNGLTVEGANGLKLKDFGTFNVTEDNVCPVAATSTEGCDPIVEFTVGKELNLVSAKYILSLPSSELIAFLGETKIESTTPLEDRTFLFNSANPEEIKVYATSLLSAPKKITVQSQALSGGGLGSLSMATPTADGAAPRAARVLAAPLIPIETGPISVPTSITSVTYTQSSENLVYFSYPTIATYTTGSIGSYQVRLKEKPTKDVFVNISPSIGELYSSIAFGLEGILDGPPLPLNSLLFTPENFNLPQTVYFRAEPTVPVEVITLNHTFEYGYRDPSDFNQFFEFLIDTLNNDLETRSSLITANVIDIKFKEGSSALIPPVTIPQVGVDPSVTTDSWLDFNIDTFKPGATTGSAVLTRTKLNFSKINQKFFEDGVNNVYEGLVTDPRACEAFSESNTAFALTTANTIKDELEKSRNLFALLSFYSTDSQAFKTSGVNSIYDDLGTIKPEFKDDFSRTYLRKVYLENFVFGAGEFAAIPDLIIYDRSDDKPDLPPYLSRFIEDLEIDFDTNTITLKERSRATLASQLTALNEIPNLFNSLELELAKLNSTNLTSLVSATDLLRFINEDATLNNQKLDDYINESVKDILKFNTEIPENWFSSLSSAQTAYVQDQLSSYYDIVNTDYSTSLIDGTGGTISYYPLMHIIYDIDEIIKSLDAQIARLDTISSFCAPATTNKTTVLANILEELILGDKKDNISINMPLIDNMPAVVQLDQTALNEIRASYKNSDETKQIEFAALNNGVGYNNFNKSIFTYGAYSLGHLTPRFTFDIRQFFNPQPTTVFSKQELFDNALTFLTKTNLQAVDYINPTLDTSYITLNSKYPKVKNFLATGAAYFDANNYSFADFATFNDSTSTEGVLVYAATKQNLRPEGTCSATTGSEDTQFYIIPYKLVTPTPIPPVVTEPPVAGPTCTVSIDSTSVPLNKDFIVNYTISSPSGFNFEGKQIRLVRTPDGGTADDTSFKRISTNELSGFKTFKFPIGLGLQDYKFSIQVYSNSTFTDNLCDQSASRTVTITATAETTGGGGGTVTPPGGGDSGGTRPPRTRSSAGSQGYCRPGATLVDDYIIRDNDLISEAITFNYNEGIFTGKPNPEKRCPKNIIDLRSNLNRIEAAKVTTTLASKFDAAVSRLAQDRWSVSDANFGYRDLTLSAPDNAWMQDIVKLAFRTKLFTGYGDSTFRPANSISYAEFMKVILLATNNASLDDFRISQYNANGQPWYTGVMAIAKDKYKLSTLDPNRPLTRGDAIVIIYELETKGLYN